VNDEVRTAARALLATPLLHADPGSPDVRVEQLRLVRKHRLELQSLFASGLGYRLVVERRAARLVKLDPGAEPPRPLVRGPQRRPLPPRAYALLALLMAVLQGGRRQYLLDELVREVRATAAECGMAVDLDTYPDRRALSAALQVLLGHGVLRERDGDVQHWAEDDRAQSLLDVDAERLALVLTGLPRITSVADLLTPDALPSSAGGARLATRRRLVESPLLDVSELPDEQREWWAKNRGERERDWYDNTLGLRLEVRAEGAVAIDPDDELSDVTFPGAGSARHVALLVLERVVRSARAERAPRVVVSADVVERAFADVTAEHPSALIAAYRDDPARLRADVAEVLRSTGLVHVVEGGWAVHAAAARFAPRPTVVTATLFEELE
jgi:uncharacterized protein (TIGR02678 family)